MTLKSGPQGCSVIAAPPDDRAPLEDEHAAPALGEEAGGDEPVVTPSDDDDVEAIRCKHGVGVARGQPGYDDTSR